MQVNHSPETNGFEIQFGIHNKNHKDLLKFFQFDIINLLFTLNSNDIVEQNHTVITKPVENTGEPGKANAQLLFYHLFKDCGIPQYYLNMKMSLDIQENALQYTSEVIQDTPDFIESLPTRTRQPKPIPISKMDITVDIPGPSMAVVSISFLLDDTGHTIISQRLRMITMIFKKMFSRLKEFIETMP